MGRKRVTRRRFLALAALGGAAGLAGAYCVAASSSPAAVPIEPPMPVPGATVPINGTELFYVERGTGLPCLCMHGGLGVDHTSLAPALDPLGDVLRLVYYDHRGNGRSGRPPIDTLTFEQFAADADALRAALGFDRVVVLAHSFGGMIGMEYALRYPGHVSHLILVDAAPSAPSPMTFVSGALRKGATPAMLRQLFAQPTDDDAAFARKLATLAPLYYHHFDPARVERERRTRVVSAAANKRGSELTQGYDLLPRLGALQVPTLILVGGDDIVNPPSVAERMHQSITGSEIAVFAQSGHFPFEEEPDAFFATVRRWLATPPVP